jgi:hypothetical protein
MNSPLRLSVLLLLVALSVGSAMAQPIGGGPPCWPPPCIPIDGGLTALLAVGAIFGGRKLLPGKRPH